MASYFSSAALIVLSTILLAIHASNYLWLAPRQDTCALFVYTKAVRLHLSNCSTQTPPPRLLVCSRQVELYRRCPAFPNNDIATPRSSHTGEMADTATPVSSNQQLQQAAAGNGTTAGQNGQTIAPPPLHIPQNTNPIPTAMTSPLSGGEDDGGMLSPGGTSFRRAAPEPNKRALYIGGLDQRVTEDVLRQIFETTGHVQNVKIIPDKNVCPFPQPGLAWRHATRKEELLLTDCFCAGKRF